MFSSIANIGFSCFHHMRHMKTLTKSQLNKFRTTLLALQSDLLSKNTPPPLEEGSDEADIAQSLIINDLNERMSQRDKMTLQKISAALHRIEDGSFGECDVCSEPIPEKRLEAMPLCILCVLCAERQ